MSITKLKLRLREAQRNWESSKKSRDVSGLPGFLPGVLQGFKETKKVLQDCHREELLKRREGRQPLSRWNAVILYRACQQAFQRLKQSDRPSAMRILQRALAQIAIR